MSRPVRAVTFMLLVAAARGQQAEPLAEVALTDGRVLRCEALAATATEWKLSTTDGRQVVVRPREIVAVHGAAVQPNRLPALYLAGGDVVRGMLAGGDTAGDFLEVQTPVLGRMRLPVDRLECIVFDPLQARPGDLELPDGVDEALFQKAALGFDRIAGTIHQFGEPGIRFQADGQAQPRWYSPRELIGLRLRSAEPGKGPADADLLTRSGDRLAVHVVGVADGKLSVQTEGGANASLPLLEVGCLTLRGTTFLSTLTPVEVREAAADGEVLMAWQRDVSVTGGPLVAGGRAHCRGLGVHSRSRLVYAVPPGAAFFWTRVAFDDEASRLPVRGAADVRVLVGETVVFEQKGLRAGDPVRDTGLIPVQPGQKLQLEVDCGAGRDLGDRIDWLSPVFLPAGAKTAGH